MYRDDDLGLDTQWRQESPEKNNWPSLIVSLHLEMELYDMVVLSVFGSCLGDHIVKISRVQLPVIDRNTLSCSKHPSPIKNISTPSSVVFSEPQAGVLLQMCMCISWQLFYMHRKKKILLSSAGIKKEYFSCKKIKVQEQSAL